MRCGKATCACQNDPDARHGPYIQWARTINGTRTTRYLTQQQRDRYQHWFDNARQLKELLAKLEIASVQAVDIVEGWSTDTPPPDETPT